jgi:hypothetical protein
MRSSRKKPNAQVTHKTENHAKRNPVQPSYLQRRFFMQVTLTEVGAKVSAQLRAAQLKFEGNLFRRSPDRSGVEGQGQG